MKRETAEVEASKLDDSSRRVLAALADHPIRLRANFLMERRSDGSWTLVATIRDTNPDVGLRRMLDYLERFTDGEIVLAEMPTVGDGMPFRVIDVCNREEYWTS